MSLPTPGGDLPWSDDLPAHCMTTATQYTYYGVGETRANPCPAGTTPNQGGLRHTTTTPGTARVSDVVYDADGRVLASKVSTADAN
jgi:hypothetical protein